MQKINYQVAGMTCGGCVAKVQNALQTVDGVQSAQVQLTSPQATLELAKEVSLSELQAAIGHYTIDPLTPAPTVELPSKSLATYWPLILIVSFITGVTLLVQYPFTTFSTSLWMRHFMAAFFLVFSFFKLLNLSGFAQSYQMYDLIAMRWKPWAYLYPFVELGLGIAYLIHFAPVLTNWLTIIILGISSLGVIRSNLRKEQIRCACLGDVFNLPMSTVTIVEDVVMVAMAVWMVM